MTTPSLVFQIAFDNTMGHEGGYSNDPDDAGAETIFGISRRYWPEWSGWLVVDTHKDMYGEIQSIPELLGDNRIQGRVGEFYKQNFWDRFQGDLVALEDQGVALEMFDTAVNMGVERAVIFLQKALNYLNRNEMIFPDLAEDGKFGPASLRALKQMAVLQDVKALLKIMNVLQGQHYLDYMKKNPVQEKFARGWFNRVSL